MDSTDDRLDRAWELWGDALPEELLSELERLRAELPDDDAERPRLALLEALALQELGDSTRAAEALQRAAAELPDDDPELLLARGEVRLARWELEPALADFERLQAASPSAASGLRIALLHDLLDDPDAATRASQTARALDPEGLAGLDRRPVERFEEVVAEAARRLPEPFRTELQGLAVVIDPVPRRELARGLESETPPDALGLFVGASALERGVEGLDLPATIYLFQRNLERACGSDAELEDEIRITLYHELGHALGFDEDGVEELGLA